MPLQFQKKKTERTNPQNLLPSLRKIYFVCPLCRGELEVFDDGYLCLTCRKKYSLHDGIPDFRVFPDPFLDYREDYARTEIVLDALEKYDLEKLLEHYWGFSDITPEVLRPKFVRSAMLGEYRAKRTLEFLDEKLNVPIKNVLEIGSGTGNLLSAAASHYENIIGIDIAMRWLHISRRRFMDLGVEVPPLVCCCAEFLPFADNSFDLIVASSTLEFVRDQPKVLSECARTLDKDGTLYLNSVNRFSLGKDPYAYLWGIGFLPRRWQAKYVRWRRDASYENVNTLSFGELKSIADEFFAAKSFSLPEVPESVLKEFSAGTRMQIHGYRKLKKLPFFSAILKRFGPGWDVILQKKKNK